jgi:uncharacterized protein (TIGR03435 family)
MCFVVLITHSEDFGKSAAEPSIGVDMTHSHTKRRSGHAALALAGAVLLAAGLAAGQEQGLQFEAASIRPTEFPSDAFAAGFRAGAATNPCGGGTLTIAGTMVSITSANVCSIIRIAYDVKDYQVTGVPSSLGPAGDEKRAAVSVDAEISTVAAQPKVFFDIKARAPGSTPPTPEQAREMLRALLRERFRLTAHHEQRELSHYALVAAKDGPNLTPAAEDCKSKASPDRFTACGQTLDQIARGLQSYTDRPVINMTNISGKFDYSVPRDLGAEDLKAAMLVNIQQRLKLRLESRKGPVDIVVVDHVEGPSEN